MTSPHEPCGQPRKRGRKPLGDRAMTSAERQQRYRIERSRAANSARDPSQMTDTVLLDRIRTSLSDGSAASAIALYVDELARRHGSLRL